MKDVRFDGPGHLLHAFGHQIPLGGSRRLSNEQAAQLAADPHVQVTVSEEPEPEPEAELGEGHTTDIDTKEKN